jgi:hypothetical protein
MAPPKRSSLRQLSRVLSEETSERLSQLSFRRLLDQLQGKITDGFLETLLSGMDAAFALSRNYRKNIEGYEGRLLFCTADGAVAAAVVFGGGDMRVHRDAIDDWDVRITFKDAPALNAFLFSKDQDIINSILANEVSVDGNLNHVYRFGFLARDLAHGLGAG